MPAVHIMTPRFRHVATPPAPVEVLTSVSADEAHPIVHVAFACRFVFMMGFGMAYTNTQTHAMAHVDGPLTADGTALTNTVQQFFGAIAMTILATIVSMTQSGLTSADAGFAPATTRGVFIGFIVVAVIVAAAFGFELAAMRHS